MNALLHFDADAAAKTLRAAHEKTAKLALQKAPDDNCRQLIKLQTEIFELVVSATVWHMNSRNRQVPEALTTPALAFTLGVIAQNYLANSQEQFGEFMEHFMTAVLNAAPSSDVERKDLAFRPQRGGQA